MPLFEEWVEPVNDLDKRLDYYFKKGFIKLPTMTKKFKNGKTSKVIAKFKEFDETMPIYDIYPRWVNEINEQVNFEYDNYNHYEELFMDLP
jgi:hypothetical protein